MSGMEATRITPEGGDDRSLASRGSMVQRGALTETVLLKLEITYPMA